MISLAISQSPSPLNKNKRAIVAKFVNKVLQERSSLTSCLQDDLPKYTCLPPKDIAFIKSLCFNILRYFPRLNYIASLLLVRPIKKKDAVIHSLLLAGIYELQALHTPPRACVHETVEAAKALKRSSAATLINACLRKLLRENNKINEAIQKKLTALYAHPSWLIQAFKQAWPQHFKSILQTNNEHPPLWLRLDAPHHINNLALGKFAPKAARLNPPKPAHLIPGYQEGKVSIQDQGAQLAAILLKLKPGLRVLDACAAPGGKLTDILNTEPLLSEVVAIEVDQKRFKQLKANLQRTKLKATCIHSAVENIESWWDKKPFDRILLDAPCSGSGVIRRHPDIKILKRPADITAFSKKQLDLLNILWPLLKPEGFLVYATCSIFLEENTKNIEKFMKKQWNCKHSSIQSSWGIQQIYGKQLLPSQHSDGFYYARLQKKKS